MTFSQPDVALVSPVPAHYSAAGENGSALFPPSPVATHGTPTTGGSDFNNYGVSTPQSPYCSVASSNNTSPSGYYYNTNNGAGDSPYSVRTYSSQGSSTMMASPGGHTQASSSAYSAYAGDNETTASSLRSPISVSSPTAKKAKNQGMDDDAYERTAPTPLNAKALALLEQSLTDESCVMRSKLLQKQKDIKRARSANLKALSLMDATVAGERQRTLSNDGSIEVKNYKDLNAKATESYAKQKALFLLNKTVQERKKLEENMNKMDIDDEKMGNTPEDISKFKSDLDLRRQLGSKSRALHLLHKTVAGEKYQHLPEKTGSNCGHQGGLTTRQAVNLEYEKRKREQMEIKAKLKQAEMKFGQVPPKITIPARPEALAESTRRRKKTAEDVRDPETVAGMKCQIDWEREKQAQARALRLINMGSKYIS